MRVIDSPDTLLRPIGDEVDRIMIDGARGLAGLQPSFQATHIFERGPDVVGYASLNNIPILTGWLHDQQVPQVEAIGCIAKLEEAARKQGLRFLVMPCTDDCRFLPDMKRMGYRINNRVTLFIKPLRGGERSSNYG